jgi:Zn-dependent peptidase ImmA (M78 family)
MTALDYQEVERRAHGVRDRLGIGDAPIADMPATLTDAGLVVLVRPLGDDGPEGLYVRRAEYGAVLLNGDSYLPRLRFTAAHELGHHEYGANAAVDVVIGATTDPEERRANAFAASFLMPREALANRVTGPAITPERVVEIANEFGVSYETLVFRLHNLGFLPGRAETRDRLMAERSAVLTNTLRQRRMEHRNMLPSDYVKRAIDAYVKEDISLDRLAELLYEDDEARLGRALEEAGLLNPADA